MSPPTDPWEPRSRPAAIVLLLLLAGQGLVFIGEASQTSDEAAHLAAGYSYLTRGDFRLNPEHPPLLKEIAALPLLALDLTFPSGPLWERAEEWNIGRLFVHRNRVSNDTILLLGRLPILALSCALGWMIFLWARELFGARAGLAALALYVLDPNVVAHSSLVTTDLGVTLFAFLTVHAVRRWAASPAPRALVLAGIWAGAAVASKFTALWIAPILAGIALFLAFSDLPLPARPWASRSPLLAPGGRLRRAGALAAAAGFAALPALLVVAAAYFGTGLPAFFQGLDFGLRHSAGGHTAYLMGRLSETGWWHYFLVAWLVKTPVGTILIVAAAVMAAALGWRLTRRDEMFLWAPIATVVVITCFWRVNIGLRHLLPIYPFLFVAAARLAAPRGAGGRPAPRAVAVGLALALAWNGVEAARIAPHYLAYFNQIVGGPRNGHLYLLDSNLDWGQSAKALRRYMTAEGLPMIYCAYSGNSDPWDYGVVYQYAPGSGNFDAPKQRGARVPEGLPREILVVSAMVRYGVHFTDHDLWSWLATRRPIAMPGWSFLAYDITRDADAHARIAALSLSFRLPDLAQFEAQRALSRDPQSDLARAVLEHLAGRAGTEASPP